MHPLDDGEQGTRKYAALTSTSSGHSEQATVEVVLSQLAQDRDYRCFSASAEYCDIGQNAGVLCGRHPVRQFTLLSFTSGDRGALPEQARRARSVSRRFFSGMFT